jgi:hypothetical protein
LIAGAGYEAQIYDPVTGTFAATGAYATYHDFPEATLLSDGKVVIMGCGCDVRPILVQDDLYDPHTGTFSATGPFYRERLDFTATLLPDGKVLVAGGSDWFAPAGFAFDDAAVYDPSTGTRVAVGNMTTARTSHTATLLPDGTVLIAGGMENIRSDGRRLSAAELYNPATRSFTSTLFTTNMTTARGQHTATLLRDGTVLIAGGGNDLGVHSSAEVYGPPSLQPPPVLFSLSGDGRGQGAILHAGTPQIASASNPAVAGEALEIFLTGLMDGSVIPPKVTIGGRMAEVLFFGKAPGFSGLNQVNVRVPSGVAPGPAVPVRLIYLGRPSNEVTIGVRR